MENPKFQVFKSSLNNQYYFRLKSKNNGEIILSSEGYISKQGCLGGINAVKASSPYDKNYIRKDGIANYTFTLESSNGEPVGRSENYTSKEAREGGISAVKRDAPQAPIEDIA